MSLFLLTAGYAAGAVNCLVFAWTRLYISLYTKIEQVSVGLQASLIITILYTGILLNVLIAVEG